MRTPRIKLRIQKDGKTLYCIRFSGGASRPGGYQNPVQLWFVGQDSPEAAYGGVTFDSERQAWWFWNQYKREHPEECEGWKPRVYEFEA